MTGRAVNRSYPAWEQPSGAQLITLWTFDPASPGAVAVLFQPSPDVSTAVRWVFARDLIRRGLLAGSHIGEGAGDVLIAVDTDDVYVWMRIRSDNGQATFTFLAADLRAFLAKTIALVPLGREDYTAAVDTFLAELFEEAT